MKKIRLNVYFQYNFLNGIWINLWIHTKKILNEKTNKLVYGKGTSYYSIEGSCTPVTTQQHTS